MSERVRNTLPKIELADEFRQALDLMENTSKNVLITGKAEVGKSTLLDYFRKISEKRVVVLAPTGVSAVNIGGETVHSFFRFKPDITLDRVKKVRDKKARSFYRNIDTIVIDEISLVRADLLDCIDKFLRLNGPDSKRPFGGIQMIFIGDLYQLPPIVRTKERDIFSGYYQSEYFLMQKFLKISL